ncbi:MAG: energy transducer TonB [Prevotella sp.]|jgi:protein TonB|nr:energy transducer TonB [Prevotella sp.]MBP8687680.1 energy transducer TonB [Prevotella sp.]MBP8935139.1 energy transducer TonB [Prevotella sp.]
MMKKLFLIIILAVISFTTVGAQNKTVNNSGKVYEAPEVMPEYLGGMEKLMEFLRTSVKYPVQAQKSKIEGRSVIGFIVEEDGSISNVSVTKGSHPLLDSEAIRVVNEMPKWKPGMIKGNPVRVKFNLPVYFKLN